MVQILVYRGYCWKERNDAELYQAFCQSVHFKYIDIWLFLLVQFQENYYFDIQVFDKWPFLLILENILL